MENEVGLFVQIEYALVGLAVFAVAIWQIWRLIEKIREPVTKLEAKQIVQDNQIIALQRDVADNKERVKDVRSDQGEIKGEIKSIFKAINRIDVSLASLASHGCDPAADK